MRCKIIFTLVSICFMFCSVYAQEVVSGKSSAQTFKMEVSYERGLPPDLFADLQFSDNNGNGVLEAEETAEFILTISNKGKGIAQDLKIKVFEDFSSDPALKIDGKREVNFLYPEKSVKFNIPITAGFYIRSAEHKLKISVDERFGYNMDPAYLLLNTLEYQAPQLTFSGYEVVDVGEGTYARVADGQIQLGERVKLKVYIQNRGQNVARNVSYEVVSRDTNLYIEQTEGNMEDFAIGEVKYFWMDVSPNKLLDLKKALPLYLTLDVEKDVGGITDYNMPVYPNQKPPENEILEVRADMDKLRQQVARFEFTSNKFTANVGNMVNIRDVPKSKIQRDNAVAIIFGIENYLELPPAPYAEADARIIKEYFMNLLGIRESNVKIITSDAAKGLIFDDMFNPDYGELQRAIVKGVTDVFVFYSGHGMPSKDGDQIYLFPSDGKVTRLDMVGYNINLLYENLQKLEAKSVNIFLDACFSGGSRRSEKIQEENLVAMKGVRIMPKVQKPWETDPTFSVFTSSSLSETSLSFDASQTGLFTYFLCTGLRGEADLDNDKKITMGELYQYIKPGVMEMSKKISTGGQTPEFHGDPDLVLVEL